MSNLSDIVQGGGGEVLDPSKFVFTEAELDAEIAAGSTSIVVAAPITITSSKTLNIDNVRISSKTKEAVLTDDGSLTAPLFTIDAQNVSLFGLSIQCDSDIFNVIDLTANASKCEISNCTIKTDVIDVIHLNEDSSNNVISDNIIEQINLSSEFTQIGPTDPPGGIQEVVNGADSFQAFGFSSDISNDGKTMIITAPSYQFDFSDPLLAGFSYARIYRFNDITNQWEAGQEFIGPTFSQFEYQFARINGNGTRIAFLQEGDVADVTIFDYNETTDQWELNTSTFTNPNSPDPMNPIVTTGIIQDVGPYRAAVCINNEGNIIGTLDYDDTVRIYEEINGAWVQKGSDVTGSVTNFFSVYYGIKSDSSGNTFLIGYDEKADTLGFTNNGGVEIITYDENMQDWVTKGSPILGLTNKLGLGSNGFASPIGISGDGNTVALQGLLNLKGENSLLTRGSLLNDFIKTYNFKDANEVIGLKNPYPILASNDISNLYDSQSSIAINLIYKYENLNWKLLDIVTPKTSLNDVVSRRSFTTSTSIVWNFGLELNYNGSVLFFNNSQSQLSLYQLNTKTKKYEQSNKLQGIELDFNLDHNGDIEDFNNDELAMYGLTPNGKKFFCSHFGEEFSGKKGFAVVFNVGVKPNILDFGLKNKVSGNSFEREEETQPKTLIRNWNSYSWGIYKNPLSGGSGSDLFYNPNTIFLSSYDEVFASNAAGIFKCPEPEVGARFRIFVMDTVAPYSSGPNAIVLKPFDGERIIDAGLPYNSSSLNGGFTLTPGASYEFVSDGTDWFTLKT
jgi:hypothetical protein